MLDITVLLLVNVDLVLKDVVLVLAVPLPMCPVLLLDLFDVPRPRPRFVKCPMSSRSPSLLSDLNLELHPSKKVTQHDFD